MGAMMEAAMERDQRLARNLGPSQRFGRSGRHAMRIGLDAVMKVVDSEGTEVLTPAADSYWEDQKRRCPWIDPEHGKERVGVAVRRKNTRLGRGAWSKNDG